VKLNHLDLCVREQIGQNVQSVFSYISTLFLFINKHCFSEVIMISFFTLFGILRRYRI